MEGERPGDTSGDREPRGRADDTPGLGRMSGRPTSPVVLDLFSCEGGAAAGYMRAGFDVYGVDREARFAKRYPGAGFTHHRGDRVRISSARLGGLVNWVDHSDAIPPWEFGIQALFKSLSARGLG